jgi:hypothetical protein
MGMQVKDVGKSEGQAVMGWIGPLESGDTHPEKEQTSDGSGITRSCERETNKGSLKCPITARYL